MAATTRGPERRRTRPHASGRAARDATIVVAADWAPIRAFEPIVRDTPADIYGDLLPVLRTADLRIVNCESALTRADSAVWKSGAAFKGEPVHVAGLTAVPFDVACLANNHVLDYGVAGLRETLRVLARAGVRTVGAGLSEREAWAPLTMQARGTAVHVVNFSEGEDLTGAARGAGGVFGWDVPRAASLVTSARRRGGLVIAIGHCGLEYVPFPPTYVVDAFRTLADAGAHAVIGHHPHVPQGMEWRNGCPIFYSLGNFVFFQPTDLLARKLGYCVLLRVKGSRLVAADLLPYRITDIGLRTLGMRERREFDRLFAQLSAPFRTVDGPRRAWAAYVDYYGQAGFTAEVQGILRRMETEPQKAAAMFRNRITTMQHAALWSDLLTAMMRPPGRPASRTATRVVEDYFTRRVD